MKQLIFSTGNAGKFNKGHHVCSQNNVELIQEARDIDEIQSEDTAYVARRKAEAAFALLQKPVIISDDAWSIPGLNGFPGTYAKSINQWLTGDDLVRLTKHLKDRRIILVQTLVYQDNETQKLFQVETTGTLLTKSSGTIGAPIQQVVSLEPSGKRSISDELKNKSFYDGENTSKVWMQFITWYKDLEK